MPLDPKISKIYSDAGELIAILPFVNDKMNGTAEFYQHGHIQSRVPYIAGLREGVAQIFRPGENLMMVATYHNDRLHGLCRIYHEGGYILQELMYQNGRRHGPYAIFSSQHHLYEEGEYENDMPVGIIHNYFPEGKIQQVRYYQGGKLLKKTIFSASGAIEWEEEF